MANQPPLTAAAVAYARADVAMGGVAVTPHDSNTVGPFRALFVGTGGDVTIRGADGNNVTFTNVADGTLLPIAGDRVLDTGTDADDIVALI